MDVIVFIRLLGLLALAFVNWIAALIGFILLMVIDNVGTQAPIKNNTLRFIVEILVYIAGIAGIWYFPLINATLAHIFAGIAIIATVLYYYFLFKKAGNKEW